MIDDVVRYADRIVVPYQPAAVVLFAGTNDIAGARPASAGYVAERFDAFVAKVRLAVPEALIFYVAITPSRARWSVAGRDGSNRLIEASQAERDCASLTSAGSSSAVTARLIPSYTATMACTRARPAIASGREIAAALHHETALMEKLGVPD